ncbi:MAG: radical SAM protein [Bacteroidales bacterium]|nr:radical SAM protein [Bacteroidales bacterium]
MNILLGLLPFWDPQIPPLGIACLKSYLNKNDLDAVCFDLNTKIEFRNIYDKYFSVLNRVIPEDKKGNIYNIGNQVVRNHLTAHLHVESQEKYFLVLGTLVLNTFYTKLENDDYIELINIVKEYYVLLEKAIRELFLKHKPTIFGLSVFGDTLGPSIFAFKLAKEINPEIKTIMGGGIFADQLAPNSPNLEYFMNYSRSFIDKYVIGEGEELFLAFVKDEIPEDEIVLSKQSSGNYLSIDELNVPVYDDFELKHYAHVGFYGARSCPFQCNFCSETINWGKYRKKEIDKTVSEFKLLNEKYNNQLFLLTDSTLNPVVTPLSEALIKADFTVYWDGFLRADKHVCSEENTILWRKGGFYRAKLGLESGSQRMLDLMNKSTSVETYKKALASLAFAGIKTTTFWLFGFPGETEEDFQKTLDFLEECKDYIYEADCNAFNYFVSGQANSDDWLQNSTSSALFPEWTREYFITQTNVLDSLPSRQDAYSRVNRFMEHCKKLGIPNPYSLTDIDKADKRWKSLHLNAVPALMDFKSNTYIDECKDVKQYTFTSEVDTEDFEFDL